MKYRPVKDVLTEAIVIGLFNITLFYMLQSVPMKLSTPILLFLCGAFIHIFFEYTGGNQWWCTQTYKI